MTKRSPSTCSLFAFILQLSKKPLLFKSFTGLTVQEFDDIYNKEIAKRYVKHEIQRLSNKKENRERERKYGAGRHFKLDIRDRFLMLLVYYRLYITYTLQMAFSLIWIKAIFAQRYTKDRTTNQKVYTHPTKNIQHYKEASNARRSREIFSRISRFH